MKILCLLIAVLLSCGASTASAACRPRPGDTDAVVKTMQDFFDAAAQGDPDKFHHLVLGGFYAYNGGERWEGDSLMRALIEWHRQGMKLAWSINDPEVHVDCDMAWITYLNRGQMQKPGDAAPTPTNWLESVALQRQGNGWKLAFLHSTRTEAAPATAKSESGFDQAQIAAALAAAPPSIASGATVIARDASGAKTVLRQGNNGWICHPPYPDGDPEPRPACTDENGQAFFKAFGAGQPPDPAKPGYSYMLQGGSGWSNTDPMAEKLPPDRKDYIHIPPHFMILDAKMANESGLPLHDPDPDTHFPFVMFGGTPYAILIIPLQ
jgi:hypothetical protein